MGKKTSKSTLKNWECKEGCKVTKHPCVHLEHLLPKLDNRLIFLEEDQLSSLASKLGSTATLDEYQEQITNLELKLAYLGLRGDEVRLVVDRFIDRLSLKEIAKLRGFKQAQNVHYALSLILIRLKSSPQSEQIKELIGTK